MLHWPLRSFGEILCASVVNFLIAPNLYRASKRTNPLEL